MDNIVLILVTVCGSSLIVALAVYLVLDRTLRADEKRRDTELMLTSRRITLPMRLQAYERLIIFMERISPDNLVMRLKAQVQSNADLHLTMLQNIRSEYEHNISQQLYVSAEVWDKIRDTKETVVAFINDSSKEVDPNTSSVALSKIIFDKLIEEGESPVRPVVNELKSEAQSII